MTDAQIEEFKRALAAGPVKFTYLKTLKDARGRTVKDVQGNPEFEEELHTAVGTLTVTGGTLVGTKQIMVGANGAGTINVRGSEAAISCASLVLSNTVALATSSTLNFTADANGVGPVKATSASLADGTKVVVDLSAYTGRRSRIKLIDTADLTADLAQLDVTFMDSSERHLDEGAALVKASGGLFARIPAQSGMLLIFR